MPWTWPRAARRCSAAPEGLRPIRGSGMHALLFSDIVDSTAISARLGDAAAAALWAAHDRAARDLRALHHGREIDRSDGFFLIFDTVADAAAYAAGYQLALAPLGLD